MSKKAQVVLTDGSIPKSMIAFTIPLLLGNLLQQLYNTADALIVGNFLGSTALASVASTGSITYLLVGFFNGLAIGAGVVISRYFGAKDDRMIRRSVHTDIAFGIICGIMMTILGVVFTPQILRLMGTPSEVLPYSILYLRVYFLGSLALVLYNVCMGILQAVGDSQHPLYYLIISSCTNIVLDLIFCGMFRLGVEFAALATIMSQFLSVMLCLRRLMRVQEVYQLSWQEVKPDKMILMQMVKNGLPTGVQNSIISLANVIVQSNINSFGQMAMAGCGAHMKIEGFAIQPIICLSMALTTFVSQNMGAKKYDRVRKGTIFGIGSTLLFAEFVGIIMFTFAPTFISLFDRTLEAIAFGSMHSRTVTLFYFLLAFSHAAAGVLRGAGKSIVPMFVMIGTWCVMRIAYISVVTHFIDDIRVIFWGYPITWFASSVIYLMYLLKGGWMKEAVAV